MKKEKRFVEILSEDNFLSGCNTVMVDRETGVNYLYHGGGYGGGLTVLVNADGIPVVTSPGELRELLEKKG